MQSGPANKRYLLVSEYFHPHWTGIAKAFLNLARTLKEDGAEVTVLTTRFSDKLAKSEMLEGIKIERSNYLLQLSRTQYSPQAIVQFAQMVSKFDTVIINSPYSNILPVSLITKAFRKKLIVFHQGDLLLSRQSGSQVANRIIEKIFDLCTIPSLAMADVVSTYSEDYATNSRVMRRFTKKLETFIPPLSPPEGGSGILVKNDLEKLKEDKLLVGFAGRFVEEKGFDVLLDAMPLVLEKIPNAHFVFAGETNVSYEKFFDVLQTKISAQRGHLSLMGLLDGDALAEFYKALDVFVLSSRSDCFALTQAEAALFGVPIVVSDIPGARFMVKSTGCGKVVEPNNPEALADGIVSVLEERLSYGEGLKQVEDFLRANAEHQF